MRSEKEQELNKLLVSARNNNKQAFAKIIDMFYGLVVCYLMKRGNQLQDAEDIAQETFLNAYKKINQYKNTGSFPGWLLKIAKNLYIDKLRKEKNKASSVESGLIEMLAKNNEAPEEIVLKKEQVKEIFAKLTPKEQLLLELRIYQKMPYSEISELMDESTVNIRVLFHRLIRRLKI